MEDQKEPAREKDTNYTHQNNSNRNCKEEYPRVQMDNICEWLLCCIDNQPSKESGHEALKKITLYGYLVLRHSVTIIFWL